MKNLSPLLAALLLIASPSFSQQQIGIFDNHTDIGPVAHPGFVIKSTSTSGCIYP